MTYRDSRRNDKRETLRRKADRARKYGTTTPARGR